MSLKEKLVVGGEKLLRFADKHSTKILTGVVIGGAVLSVIFASEATVRAIREIDEEEHERDLDAKARADREHTIFGKNWQEAYDATYEPLTNFDKFKIGWKYYIPTFLTVSVVISSAIGAQVINTRRQAALAGAAEAAQVALKKYQEKVIEQIGENKERKVQHAMHEDEIKNLQIPDEYIKRCGAENGESLFYDPKSGQEFVSTYERVRQAADKANKILREEADYYAHALFISDCGGKECEFSYNNGIPSKGMSMSAIDQDYFLEPHTGMHNGHEVTIVYMNYDTISRESY